MPKRLAVAVALAVLSVGGAVAAFASSGSHVRTARRTPSRVARVPRLVGLTRTQAERALADRGLRPSREGFHVQRYAPVTVGQPDPVAFARSTDLDRKVTAQAEDPGYLVPRGSPLPFATAEPPRPSGGRPWLSPVSFSPNPRLRHPVVRYAVGVDDRILGVSFPAPQPRCLTIDHVDVVPGRQFVVASPYAISGEVEGCGRQQVRRIGLELSQPLSGRVLLERRPSAPRRHLFHVAAASWDGVSRQPRARALAVYFSHGSSCGFFAGARVRETARAIHVRFLTGDLERGNGCFLDLLHDAAVVPLRHPVGSRRIVDDSRSRRR